MIEKSKHHNFIVKFLKHHLNNRDKIVPSQGVIILDIGKWSRCTLDIIEAETSQKQYDIAILHATQTGKAMKKLEDNLIS